LAILDHLRSCGLRRVQGHDRSVEEGL